MIEKTLDSVDVVLMKMPSWVHVQASLKAIETLEAAGDVHGVKLAEGGLEKGLAMCREELAARGISAEGSESVTAVVLRAKREAIIRYADPEANVPAAYMDVETGAKREEPLPEPNIEVDTAPFPLVIGESVEVPPDAPIAPDPEIAAPVENIGEAPTEMFEVPIDDETTPVDRPPPKLPPRGAKKLPSKGKK